ncbi:hypothetical protein [Streptomyces sp. NPDC020983]|uniref:hypothetical protein n=1 Tax=Streptomyces sp. NPDC020983 TaxID=3365106 RepID=UPI00379202A5
MTDCTDTAPGPAAAAAGPALPPGGRLPRLAGSCPRHRADLVAVVVPPGVHLVARDAGYAPPALSDPALRRRSHR